MSHVGWCMLHVACGMVYVAFFMLLFACCMLHSASCMVYVACYMLHVTYCMGHAACCMVHDMWHMLHDAICIIHVACCIFACCTLHATWYMEHVACCVSYVPSCLIYVIFCMLLAITRPAHKINLRKIHVFIQINSFIKNANCNWTERLPAMRLELVKIIWCLKNGSFLFGGVWFFWIELNKVKQLIICCLGAKGRTNW